MLTNNLQSRTAFFRFTKFLPFPWKSPRPLSVEQEGNPSTSSTTIALRPPPDLGISGWNVFSFVLTEVSTGHQGDQGDHPGRSSKALDRHILPSEHTLSCKSLHIRRSSDVLVPNGLWTDLSSKLEKQTSSPSRSFKWESLFGLGYLILQPSHIKHKARKRARSLLFLNPNKFSWLAHGY